MKRFGDNTKKFEQQLKNAVLTNDKKSELNAYMCLGAFYYSKCKYQDAVSYFEKLVNITIELGDKAAEGIACCNLGTAYQSLGKHHEALKLHEKRLNIARETGDKVGEARAYGDLGVSFRSLGKYHQALKLQEKRLSIAIEIGDKALEGIAYCNLGTVYNALGKYHKALEYYEKQLSIAIETGNKAVEGAAYGNLGGTYQSLGKYHEALKCHEKQLRIDTEIGNKTGNGIAYCNFGATYQLLGKYHEALKYQKKQLSIAKETGHKGLEGAAYCNLGATYQSLGKYREALKCHEKQLSIAIEIGDKAGEGTAYGNFGEACQALGKYHEVLKYKEKHLSIVKEIGNKDGEAAAYSNLGKAYYQLGKYHEALKCHEKHLSIAKETGDKRGEGIAYGNLGAACGALENYDESLKYHKQSLSIATDIDDCINKGVTLLNLGLICFTKALFSDEKARQEHLKNFEHHFKNALECFEWIFDNLEGQDKLKISIFDNFITAYKDFTFLLVLLNQFEKSLLVAERGRARALGDLLVSNYFRQGWDYRSIILTYDDIESLLPNNKYSIFVFTLLRKNVATWHLTHEKPPMFNLQQVPPLEASDEDQGYVEESLEEIVEAAFDEMQVRARNLFIEEPEFGRDPLEKLYQFLMRTEEEDLKREEIVIIPDGLLFKVPFAALRDPNTQLYLSDTKRVRIAPSLTTLKILQRSSADYHNNTGVLIVGNPAVEKVIVKGETKRFGRLPGAEHEALVISKLMGVTPLIGDQATKQVLKQLTLHTYGPQQIYKPEAHDVARGSMNLLCPKVTVNKYIVIGGFQLTCL